MLWVIPPHSEDLAEYYHTHRRTPADEDLLWMHSCCGTLYLAYLGLRGASYEHSHPLCPTGLAAAYTPYIVHSTNDIRMPME